LDKQFNQRLTAATFPRITLNYALDQFVGIASSIIADAAASWVQSRYGLNEAAWQVVSTKLAVQTAIEDAYAASTTGAATGGASVIAASAQVAVSQIIDSATQTYNVLASDQDIFQAARQSNNQLRLLASQIQASNPVRARKLWNLASQSDAEIAQLQSQLNNSPIIRIFNFFTNP
jgi:hypothetical protein